MTAGLAAGVVMAAVVLLVELPAGGNASTPAAVPTVTAVRGRLDLVVAATATFELEQYVDVGAQISGQLKAVLPKLGERVRRGQLVALIDDSTARARLAQSEGALASIRAQLAARQAQLDLAHAQHQRIEPLARLGYLTLAEADTARTSVASLEAEAASLRAQGASLAAAIGQARTELQFAQVRAPLDGTVVALVARPGQALNATQQAPTILRIGNLDSLVLVAAVSEADIVRVRPGLEVRFHLLGLPEQEFRGRVKEILPAPRIVNTVVFYDAMIELAARDERFRLGMTAQAYFQVAQHPCMLKIPRAALPAGLRPPQPVELTMLGNDGSRRIINVEITAVDEMDGGVSCAEAGRVELTDGARIVLPAVPRVARGASR